MLANDIKKGARVQLRGTGWYGTMADNARGNIRMVDVEGLYREIGSVYTHDIERVMRVDCDGEVGWEPVELSPAQQKNADRIKASGF